MGILLWVVSKLLAFCLSLPSFVHTVIDGLRFGNFWVRVNDIFFDSAYAEDVYGNTAYRSMLNALFIKRGGYHYGHRKESISSATGKSQVKQSLTTLGEGLAGFLALLDPEHSYKSIEDTGYDFDATRIQPPLPVAWWKTTYFILLFLAVLAATLSLWWWIFGIFVKWVYPYV